VAARVVLSLDGHVLQEFELEKPVTVVGRHPDCDIVVEDAAVSGRHMLFRVVNRTVYAEDLASTNGTRVNGLSVQHQVVHHLDVIEVGRHKAHFFDDTMLTGSVGGLENTVLTEYERTMIADHVPPPQVARPAVAVSRELELDRTQAIQRDTAVRLGPAQESVRTGGGEVPAPSLSLRVVAGERRGETLSLQRANSMIGTPGADTALVVRRGDHYYIARFSGNRAPRLNGRELGPGTHPIAAQDVIEVGASSFEVIKVA
jgi:pSer/pThr/pTyr-binding forkhead associated (FHA) protein